MIYVVSKVTQGALARFVIQNCYILIEMLSKVGGSVRLEAKPE